MSCFEEYRRAGYSTYTPSSAPTRFSITHSILSIATGALGSSLIWYYLGTRVPDLTPAFHDAINNFLQSPMPTSVKSEQLTLKLNCDGKTLSRNIKKVGNYGTVTNPQHGSKP